MRPSFAAVALLAVLFGGAMPAWATDPPAAQQATPEIGGPFTLVDQDGHLATDTKFRGKWLLVYFGYTHCPDVCPTALSDMAAAIDGLDPARRSKVQVIFITVDPDRDTPKVMKDYVSAFEDANITGLTGTRYQVNAAAKAYQVRVRRREGTDGDYTMSHSSTINIMGPDGRFIVLSPPERIADHLAELVR